MCNEWDAGNTRETRCEESSDIGKYLRPIIEHLERRTLFAAHFSHVSAELPLSVTDAAAVSEGSMAFIRDGNVVDIYDAGKSKWVQHSLSQARISASVSVVGDDVVFAGGKYFRRQAHRYQDSAALDVFNVHLGRWYTSNLFQPESNWTATGAGSDLLLVEPQQGPGEKSQVQILNLQSGAWSESQLSQARSGFVTAVVGEKAIFAGGRFYQQSGESSDSDVIDMFDASGGTWSVAALSSARSAISAATVGDKVVLAGGNVEPVGSLVSSVSNVVDVYDSDQNAWTSNHVAVARSGMAIAVVGGKAVFAGGSKGIDGPSNAVDIFDASSGQWSTSRLSVSRSGVSASVVGSIAFFGGGIGGRPSAAVDIFNGETLAWSVDHLTEAREQAAATSVAGTAIFAGGSTENDGSDVVDLFVRR